jgi:hypothetical protein
MRDETLAAYRRAFIQGESNVAIRRSCGPVRAHLEVLASRLGIFRELWQDRSSAPFKRMIEEQEVFAPFDLMLLNDDGSRIDLLDLLIKRCYQIESAELCDGRVVCGLWILAYIFDADFEPQLRPRMVEALRTMATPPADSRFILQIALFLAQVGDMDRPIDASLAEIYPSLRVKREQVGAELIAASRPFGLQLARFISNCQADDGRFLICRWSDAAIRQFGLIQGDRLAADVHYAVRVADDGGARKRTPIRLAVSDLFIYIGRRDPAHD